MIRILAVCPVPADGTAWWRIVSPLGVMQQDWPGFVQVEISHEPDHVKLCNVDLLILQRPMREGDKHMLKCAKRLCIPVIVDYDDDYTAIPAHNPRARQYMAPAQQALFKFFLTEADVVTVSTPALKKKWGALNKRVIVVPNGLDDRLYTPTTPTGRLRPRTVVWRGGDSHQDDLRAFAPALAGAAQAEPCAIWHFVGNPAGDLARELPPGCVVEHPFSDVTSYFEALAKIAPHVLVVPLADTWFNRCKSNISILEGTWAGAVVIAPKWPGWNVPGVFSYGSPAELELVLRNVLAMPEQQLKATRDQTWAVVRERALASRSNLLRAAVFSELVREAKTKRFDRPDVADLGKALKGLQSVSGDEAKAGLSVEATTAASSELDGAQG